MSLYDATRNLHHQAEQHPFGARMAAGRITAQEWADWLAALRYVHRPLDPQLPPALQRGGTLLLDLARTLPVKPRLPWGAEATLYFAGLCNSTEDAVGVAYILSGAHLRGGAVIRKRLEPLGFSCAHLRFDQPREANDFLCALRDADRCADGARRAFMALMAVMDEIDTRPRGWSPQLVTVDEDDGA